VQAEMAPWEWVCYLLRGKRDLEVTDGRDTKQTSERASSQECDLRVRSEEQRPTDSKCSATAGRTAELLALTQAVCV
jgi:hypothetical protein